MGEMADWILENLWDYESGYYPEQPEDYYVTEYRFACKYCGCGKLKWKYINDKWRLVDKEDKIHDCLEYYYKD